MTLLEFKRALEEGKTKAIGKIPAQLQTVQALLTEVRSGDRLVHLIISAGADMIRLVDKNLWEPRVLMAKDKNRTSCLHMLIQRGLISYIPKEKISEQCLLQKDENGTTLMHVLCNYSEQKHIKASLITPKNLSVQNKRGIAPIHVTKTFKDIPKAFLTPKLLAIKDNYGRSGIHHSMLNHTAQGLPKELLSPEVLLEPDHDGVTPVHLAAGAGILDHLPKDSLTPKVMAAKDKYANTVAHYIAKSGKSFRQLPAPFLNGNFLLQKNKWGETALDQAAKNSPSMLYTIPDHCFTKSQLEEVLVDSPNDSAKDWADSKIMKIFIKQRTKREVQDGLKEPLINI